MVWYNSFSILFIEISQSISYHTIIIRSSNIWVFMMRFKKLFLSVKFLVSRIFSFYPRFAEEYTFDETIPSLIFKKNKSLIISINLYNYKMTNYSILNNWNTSAFITNSAILFNYLETVVAAKWWTIEFLGVLQRKITNFLNCW